MSSSSVSASLAAFVHGLSAADISDHGRERALLSILDGIGIALAASRSEFADCAANALLTTAPTGLIPVIGRRNRYGMHDAALLNGVMVHGLDFDDTHLRSAIHPTASLLPTVLATGYQYRRSGADVLAAYVGGLEAMVRIGNVGGIFLREQGFHTTSMIGTFGCALAAGKLMGLSERQLCDAQGLALSMASGVIGASAGGGDNKRLHGGWAAQAGIAAAAFASGGFKGVAAPYEGQYGLLRASPDPAYVYAALTEELGSLGTIWECANIAIKPIPACHLTHACSDAAIHIRRTSAIDLSTIRRIVALVPPGAVPVVCEPVDVKRRPTSGYAAQFSIPYVVAASLARGAFGFAELEAAALTDPEILSLCDKVEYAPDPNSSYPRHRTGEIRIETADGRILVHREAVNRGHPECPLSREDVRGKFESNASCARSAAVAAALADDILALELLSDIGGLIDGLAG